MPELPADLKETVTRALAEDVGDGDITAQLIDADLKITAKVVSKEAGILCGQAWAEEVFRQLQADMELQWKQDEGASMQAGMEILRLEGYARALLTGERTALNFLQTLSGTATATRQLVDRVAHTPVTILDTRKTVPGLRTAQKYAVQVGGARNHRMGLFDAFLIKENHIASCGGIAAAIAAARNMHANKKVEIEVQNLEQLEQALAGGADIVMLDNFELSAIVQVVQQCNGRARLEASGGIDAETLVSIAETGVDYISIGAMTKHCRAVDLSLLIG